MPSKTDINLQQWQLYNPLDKSTKPPDMPQSRKLPYSKSTAFLKEDLKQPKVSSVGVAPPRKSFDVNELKVMLVGSSLSEKNEPNTGDTKTKKKALAANQYSSVENTLTGPHKMPAIVRSEGTTGKPSFVMRAKPPSMPRTKLKQKRKPKVLPHQSYEEMRAHTTTPVHEDEQREKSARTYSYSRRDSSEQVGASKSVVSIEITEPSGSPVRSVDEMIQALRSSRQASATEKSLSDQKIDEIMQQVMSHAKEWMEETVPKQGSDEFEESNLPSAPTPSAVHVPNTPAIEERYEPVDETDVDVSDTVSTLASQISAPAGIPDVKEILARKSSHAMQRQSASETSSPAMMLAADDDESVDLEQAQQDYNMPLDVYNHDILAIHGSHPPLIEKPAFPKASDDILAWELKDEQYAFSIGGRMHRLCLLPSIDELNVSPKEMALTSYTHSKPPPEKCLIEGGGKEDKKDKANQAEPTNPSGSIKDLEREQPSNILDTSKLDPLDIDGWKKLVEGAIDDKDYTIAGSGTDPSKVSAWRLLWSIVPPKMALSTSAVKALVFPYYHGSQIIEDEVVEKESWTDEDELSQIVIEDENKYEFNERTLNRRHASLENLSRLYEDRERFVKHVKSQPLERFGVHKTARDLFEDRRLRPLPLVSRTDTDSQNEEEKEKKDVEEKVSTEDVDLDGNPLKRHPSLPNIPLAVTASSSLCLMKTDYTSGMDDVKHQRELALRQQISEQHLKEKSTVPQASAAIQQLASVEDTANAEKTERQVQPTASQDFTPGKNFTSSSTALLHQTSPSKTALSKGKKRSYVMLHKKKSKPRKSKKFYAKLHRSLITYNPMPLKRTLSNASFFPPDLKIKSSLRKKKTKSNRLRGKITRSTSVPYLDEFGWFVWRHLKYGDKIDDMREWVRDIWNGWFDQVYPPTDDESSTESMSEDLLETMEDVEEAKEIKKTEIKKLTIPDKISPSLIFFVEDIDEPEEFIREVIDDLTHELDHLSDEKIVERACHLTKRGSLLRKMGEIRLASLDLDLALELEPRIAAAYWQRHLIRLLRHQRHEALDDLNALLKIDSKCVHAYRSRADIYASLGDYTMAIVNYSQAIKIDPQISEAYYQRANIFEKTGDMLLAMEDYSAVHKLNPVRTDALLRRALYHYTKKSWLVAVSDFTQLIQHEPLNSQARTYRARASTALGNYQSALKDFSAAIHYDPLNSIAYYHRGALLRKAAPEKALQDLSVSLLLDNSERNVLALLHRGILYSETRRYSEALADFEHTLRIDGSIVCAHVNIGIIQMKVNQNYWEAIKRFTAALKQDPTYTRAHICRADAYALIHDYNKAVKDITRAIHLRPGERHLYLRRGKFLLQLKKLKLAAFCVQHISTSEKSFISSSATQQAVVQSFLGNHEEACESLSGACRRNPIPSMYVLLAKTMMKAKRFKDARVHLRHALELTGIYTDEVDSKVKESISEETRIHFLLGQCGMEMGKHEEALTSYNHALKENSCYAEAYYHRGLCKLKLGMAQGIQDLNRALALNPNLFEAFLSRAAYYSTKERYSKAILNCNEALRLRPRSVRALLCRGALKYRISAYYHAINDLAKAIELDKRCALAYYNRAVCLHKTKEYHKALKDYSIVLVLIENDNSDAGVSLRTRVFVNRSLLYLCADINEPQNAAFDLELASTLHPDDTGILHTMAICYHKMQDLSGAHSAYSRCLTVNPSFLAAYVGRGDVYGDAGDFKKSKIEYERALRLDPTYVDAHVHLGYNLHMCGYLHQAWMQFSKALEQDPSSRSALEGRAVTCLHAGDAAAASRDVQLAMKCGDATARLLTVYGVVEQTQNEFQSAMAHYLKAQEIDPFYTPAHFNSAVLYLRERRFAEAFESLQVVIRASPDDSAALLNRAIVRVFLNKPENAMNDFNYASKLDPQNSHIFYNRANLHFILEDYENAVKDYSIAFDINPSDYVSLKKRADAKGRLGMKKEAVEDYRLSLELLEKHERLQQLKAK